MSESERKERKREHRDMQTTGSPKCTESPMLGLLDNHDCVAFWRVLAQRQSANWPSTSSQSPKAEENCQPPSSSRTYKVLWHLKDMYACVCICIHVNLRCYVHLLMNFAIRPISGWFGCLDCIRCLQKPSQPAQPCCIHHELTHYVGLGEEAKGT